MVDAQIGNDTVVINGKPIREAVPPAQLHEVLGQPDRIVDPAAPAPFGHRNNQIHVYDRFGLYFNEHHWTRLAEGITFVLWPEEQGYRFTPSCRFSGRLSVVEYPITSGATEAELIELCPAPWQSSLQGTWQAKLGGIGVYLSTKGKRLKSGRRSGKRRVVDLSASWKHDPWGRELTPEETGHPGTEA